MNMDDTDLNLIRLAGLAAGEKYSVDRNPLNDDALSLRLAVKLGIRVEPMAMYCVTHAGSVCAKQFSELAGDDPYAATRRAITRAAAEIGRAMP